jgi:phospholipid/cholesterol/gamma-HCH transport system ATP-binding protein
MIRTQGLWKYFNGKPVLEDINTRFESGKVNMIIGKSGSGKTVLLKCIVGLFIPEQGKIYYDDIAISAHTKNELKNIRRHMGMVFQGGALFDSLTVLENVMFPLEMFTNMTYHQRRKQALEMLRRVGLVDVEDKYPNELSGGMKKRVAIARAIVNRPKYLFFDEPNSGLDPITARVIDNLIVELVREFNPTTIINTHDIQSVIEMGEKVIFIHQGKKWWEGTSQQMLYTDNQQLKDFLQASGFETVKPEEPE